MLVRELERVVLLFTPPFDRSQPNPGYIAGYLPGVRENGGQYTHAATWVIDAFARLGQGERAVEALNLLNPILASTSPESAKRYAVEPYVLAGDVYGSHALIGRGGWTWYTGSASWLYRVGLEAILGFRPEGDRLVIDPCIPAAWPGFSINYRHRSARYEIRVENPEGVERGVRALWLDGNRVEGEMIPLADDGGHHDVRVVLGTQERQ